MESRSSANGLADTGRRRSTETDLFGPDEGVFKTEVEFLETKGDGYLLEEVEDEETEDAFEVEVKVDGDMYLEETILDLGLLDVLPETPLLLSFSEGNKGGLLERSSLIFAFCGSVVEATPEAAATIITAKNTRTNTVIVKIRRSQTHPEAHLMSPLICNKDQEIPQ